MFYSLTLLASDWIPYFSFAADANHLTLPRTNTKGLIRPLQSSIAVPFFSELSRVGSVERGEKCTAKARKIP